MKRAFILVFVLLFIAGCGTQPVIPDTHDWCYRFDFALSNSFNVAVGEWQEGLGYVTDDTFRLSLNYGQALSVTPLVVNVGAARIDSGDLNVAANGIIFGIAGNVQGILPAALEQVNLAFEPATAGENGSTANVSVQSSGAVAVTYLEIYGALANPFGVSNCGGFEPTPTPEDTATDAPTNTAIPATATNTPTPTGTPQPTTTATNTPSPTPSCGLDFVLSFRINDYDGVVVSGSNYPTGTWANATGWQSTFTTVFDPDGYYWYYEFDLREAFGGLIRVDSIGYEVQSSGYTGYYARFYREILGTWSTQQLIGAASGYFNYPSTSNVEADYPIFGVSKVRLNMQSEFAVGTWHTFRIRGCIQYDNPPTNTPLPTNTFAPTNTPLPTATNTPNPTMTLFPNTATPNPTATRFPINPTTPPTFTAPPLATLPPPQATATADAAGTATANATASGTPNATETAETPGTPFGTPMGTPTLTSDQEAVGEAVIGLGNSIGAAGGNLFNLLNGYLGQVGTAFTGTVDAWYAAPPKPIQGLPQCKTDPYSSDWCAILYILQYTVFSGTLGSLIIPLGLIVMDLAIILQFIRLGRAILARGAKFFQS